MLNYYTLDGHEAKPYDAFGDTQHVADETIGNVRISTVFLGLDHSFGEGPPLIFETMIFGGAYDQFQDRYTTWKQAEAGHKRVVAALRAGKNPNEPE